MNTLFENAKIQQYCAQSASSTLGGEGERKNTELKYNPSLSCYLHTYE
jgi:hypothetical protein